MEYWNLEQEGRDACSHNIPVFVYVDLPDGMPFPGVDAWNRALEEVAKRHETLRTSYYQDADGNLRRSVSHEIHPCCTVTDIPDTDSASARFQELHNQDIPLGRAPLWHAGCMHISDSDKFVFWMSMHHIIGDGKSAGMFLRDLMQALSGCSPAIPRGTTTYQTTADRDMSYLKSERAGADKEFWTTALAEVVPAAFGEWPVDTSRDLAQNPLSSGCHRLYAIFDMKATEAMQSPARQLSVSLHTLWASILALEVFCRSGKTQLLMGTPVDIREDGEAENMGYCVNELPLVFNVHSRVTFGDLVDSTQRKLENALMHSKYPFRLIAEEKKLEMQGDCQAQGRMRHDLFDISVTEIPSAQNVESKGIHFRRRTLEEIQGSANWCKTSTWMCAYERTSWPHAEDIVLMHEIGKLGEMHVQWHMNDPLYSRTTAESWFQSILPSVLWLTENTETVRSKLISEIL
eukprot:ANDGO_03164.mRNA.1 Linear gramicidin synthase subunit C